MSIGRCRDHQRICDTLTVTLSNAVKDDARLIGYARHPTRRPARRQGDCQGERWMSSKGHIAIDKDKTDLVLGLPPANTKRWVSRRKAAIVLATRAGVISREEAYERYALSPEELAAWEAAFEQHGIRSLRITWQRNYRRRGR
jgi:hypothetical protein